MHSIKRAYRRKALELHPDRNYGGVEDTTKLFAEVQAAYGVLSDPQERAWYDSHREEILRGESEDPADHYEHDLRMTTAHDIMRMFTKLNGPLDYSDSPSGFYESLRDTFDGLAREELAACEWRGLEPVDFPSFGHANDDYEHVAKPFYSTWGGFATSKSFSWKDAFRYSDAPDRRVRRMMEKENKRMRDEGIREYNDAVRSMVAFVRKRDPRYMPNTRSEAERQEVLRNAAAAQAARSRAANQAKLKEYVRPEWTKTQASEVSVDSEGDEKTEEERIEEHYECVACAKTFKSEKQFEVHEKSKKHAKAIRELKRAMQKDQQALKLDDSRCDDLASSPATVRAKPKLENDIEPDGSRAEGSSPSMLDTTEVGIDLHSESIRSSSHSSTDSLSKTIYSNQGLRSANDECASTEDVESRVFGGTDTSKSGSEDETEGTSVVRGVGAPSKEEGSHVPDSKLGKAKVKKARRAARKEGAQRDDEV